MGCRAGRKLAARAAAPAAAVLALAALTACSPSAPPAPRPLAAEQVTAEVTGAQALNEITGKAPVAFPVMFFSGAVATVARNVTLASHAPGATKVITTPAGDVTIQYGSHQSPRRALLYTGPPGSPKVCVFSQVIAEGGFTVTAGTGKFTALAGHGHGTFTLTFITEAENTAGKPCDPHAPGPGMPAGSQVDFTASNGRGPLI